jgi:hypothetical protein
MAVAICEGMFAGMDLNNNHLRIAILDENYVKIL